jgi:H+/Cl- antiporter ClcA
MKEWLKQRIKKAGENIESTITQIILIVILGGTAAIYAFAKKTFNIILQLLNAPTPLWAAILLIILLIILCVLYTRFRIRQHEKSYKPLNVQEKLHEEFGVYWNNQYKLRCLKCKSPLKCASPKVGSSIFFCSNCDSKHPLRDKDGKYVTEAEAIEELKKLQKMGKLDFQ